LPVTRLAQQLAMTSGGVTKLVDGLVEAGHATRGSSDRDRRVVLITLTAGGRQLAEQLAELQLSRLREIIGDLDGPRFDELAATLHGLREQADRSERRRRSERIAEARRADPPWSLGRRYLVTVPEPGLTIVGESAERGSQPV
jgi:DNA-binding MarR family transcriptional regulator